MNTAEHKTSQITTKMQIAGNRCKVCAQKITLSAEGKYCALCQAVVHTACAPNDACSDCGQPYQLYERPKVDPLSDAVLPRALRPAKSGAPLLAVFIMMLVLMAVITIGFVLTHMTRK